MTAPRLVKAGRWGGGGGIRVRGGGGRSNNVRSV